MIASPLERNLPGLFHQIDTEGMNRRGAGTCQAVAFVDPPCGNMAFMGPQCKPLVSGTPRKAQTLVKQGLRDTAPPCLFDHVEQAQLGNLRVFSHTKDAAQARLPLMCNPSRFAIWIMLHQKRLNDLCNQGTKAVVESLDLRVMGRMLVHEPVGIISGKGAQRKFHSVSLPPTPLPIKPTAL